MFTDKEKLYQIYHSLLSMAISCALVLAVNQYYTLRVHILLCISYALIPSVLVYVSYQYRKNTLTYLLLLSLFPAVGLLFWIRGLNPVIWLRSIAQWVYEYDGSEILYQAAFANIVLLGVAIVCSLLFFLLMRNHITKVLLAVIMFLLLIISSITSTDIHKSVIGISFFYILSVLIELTGILYSKRSGRKEKKVGILYLTPVCLLVAILSVSMPSKLEPIQWKGVKAFYYNIRDRIDVLITEWEFFRGKGQEEFSLALTGYSEEGGNLGQDSLARSDNIALQYRSLKKNSSVYLVGSVSDIYTGYSWKKSRQDTMEGEKEYLLDYMELVYALSRQDSEILYSNRYLDRNIFYINYKYIKSKTFFYPAKTSWYEVTSETVPPQDDSSNILFPKAVGEGTSYQLIFYEMNLEGEAFQAMLREADEFSYSDENRMDSRSIKDIKSSILYVDNAESLLYNQDSYKQLAKRADLIREIYTQLPESLPERVRELALEITKNQETTYDTLKAIEAYLVGYSYNLQPGGLPEGKDFVDYFLFENQKGFCTSFASAMAILARCVEIPTRYVEGFLVDYEDKFVRNDKAHSWAEAYIEGVGWVPFEATPPFYGDRYSPWSENKKDPTSMEDYSDFLNNEPLVEIPKRPEENETGEVKTKGVSGVLIGGIILISTLFTVLILLSLYYMVISRQYKKALKMADNSERMYMYFLRILTLLKKEGYPLGTQDTIQTLADRIGDQYHYEGVTFLRVAVLFMGYRYGKQRITKEECDQVEGFYQGLLSKQRTESGPLKLLLEEFIFLARKGYR